MYLALDYLDKKCVDGPASLCLCCGVADITVDRTGKSAVLSVQIGSWGGTSAPGGGGQLLSALCPALNALSSACQTPSLDASRRVQPKPVILGCC